MKTSTFTLASGAAVTWSTAVVSGAATADIYVTVSEDQHSQKSLWARSGQPVDAARLRAAQYDELPAAVRSNTGTLTTTLDTVNVVGAAVRYLPAGAAASTVRGAQNLGNDKVTIAPLGTNTIDGGTDAYQLDPGKVIRLQSDGAGAWVEYASSGSGAAAVPDGSITVPKLATDVKGTLPLTTPAVSTATTGTLTAGTTNRLDATSAPLARTLPTAAAAGAGGIVVVKKLDTSTNAVTVNRAGSDTINVSGTSRALSLPFEAVHFRSDGVSDWTVVASDTPVGQLDGRYPQRANNLSDVANAATSRTNLGLGSAATMTPATLAADTALTSTYVQKAPAPASNSAVDTPALQALLDAAEAVGGGEVLLQAGLYRITGLDIGAKVALKGVGDGSILRLDGGVNRPAVRSKNYAALMAAYNTDDWQQGTPFNIRLENFRIEGNGASNDTTSHGIALYAFRTTVRNVYIYDTGGDGFKHDGSVGTTTGTYPNGQVESILENIWVRSSRGVGVRYSGPNDAYADKVFVAATVGTADGAVLQNIDLGYMHVYGAQRGVVINGNVRADHIQAENNRAEGLVATSQGAQTNNIGRLTVYGNWSAGAGASTDYAVRVEGTLNLGDALVNTSGSGGIIVTTNADYTTIRNAKVTGVGGSGGYNGLWVAASYSDITASISSYATGCTRDFNHNKSSNLKLRITACPSGFYENGLAAGGDFFDISYEAGATNYTPWTLSSVGRNFYRLVSYGQIVSAFIADPNGVSSTPETLGTGEATMRRKEVGGGVSTTSGTLYLTYLTARKTESCGNLRIATNSVAAAATPTLCRLGVYSVDSSGNLALVGSVANDTTLFAGTFTTYTRALSASFTKVAGQRYAVGVLVVSGAAMPQFYGNGSLNSGEAFLAPTEAAGVTSQADLPSSITVGSLSATGRAFYVALTP